MRKMRHVIAAICLMTAGWASASSPSVQQSIRGVLDLELEPPVVNSCPDPAVFGFDKIDFAMNGGLAMTKGGRMFLVWHAGEDGCGCYLVGTWSDDGGRTWTGTRFVVGDRRPIGHIGVSGLWMSVLISNVWSAPDSSLRLYLYQAVNMFNGRGTLWEVICRNPDADEPTWDPPRRIGWGGMHNKPIVLSDGTWLLPTDFERNIPQGGCDPFPELEPLRGCGVTVSADGGASWTWRGRARPTGDGHFCEHAIVELADRSLLMYLRTGGGLKESRSSDGGVTWTEPKLPDVLRQVVARFGFIKLSSGHLLIVKNGPSADEVVGNSREQLSAYMSCDEGRTWRGGLMLDERRRVSYPDVVQTDDGRIYVSYDHDRNTKTDEILLASFTEQEVLSGKLSEPDSFLKRTVFTERQK